MTCVAVVYFSGTSEDEIYVQAVTGLILDMLEFDHSKLSFKSYHYPPFIL